MQDEHLVSILPGEVMDDRRNDNAEQPKRSYIIWGCPWCKDHPEAAYDYQRLKDEAEDIQVLIRHLERHAAARLLALNMATHVQNASFCFLDP